MTLSTYEFTVRCGAPPDVVFEVLADATHWKDWAGSTIGVSEWDREGVPAPGGRTVVTSAWLNDTAPLRVFHVTTPDLFSMVFSLVSSVSALAFQ